MTLEEIMRVKDSITYDDGQNVRVDGMESCPWCGHQEYGSQPYVQVGPEWGGGGIDARVVCPVCHVATSHEYSPRMWVTATGEDVTRLNAIALAVFKWNHRKGK